MFNRMNCFHRNYFYYINKERLMEATNRVFIKSVYTLTNPDLSLITTYDSMFRQVSVLAQTNLLNKSEKFCIGENT